MTERCRGIMYLSAKSPRGQETLLAASFLGMKTHTPLLDLYTERPMGPAFLAMHRLNQTADHQGIKTFWRKSNNSALRRLIL